MTLRRAGSNRIDPLSDASIPLIIKLSKVFNIGYSLHAPSPIELQACVAFVYPEKGGMPIEALLGDHGQVKLPPGKYELRTRMHKMVPTRKALR